MPVYEYRCKSCESRFDALRPIAQADAPVPCPTCAATETMRLLSVFAAQVKSGKSSEIGGGACATSEAMGVPCCGGMCAAPGPALPRH